jgi:Cof subfamily protein (haloacid dehalogenase superfamily)
MSGYDAVLIDLDGTLIEGAEGLRPENVAALRAAEARGKKVMIATGRSTASARPVLEQLELSTPAVVFNGAAVWCPKRTRLIEERILSSRTLERSLAFAAEHDLLTILMASERKWASPPRDPAEARALQGLRGLEVVPRELLAAQEFIVRVTMFSATHAASVALMEAAEAHIRQPVYTTHFPLSVLHAHRESPMSVIDIHPPCRGKAEGMRVLRDLYGIEPERVVAIGDATNDLPMFAAAGLALATEDGMDEAKAAAHHIIGPGGSTAIARAIEQYLA